ncbi:MAG TPA: hypothetical protein VGH81_02545 [Rudaea sp.]|jgi:hypothetical protein
MKSSWLIASTLLCLTMSHAAQPKVDSRAVLAHAETLLRGRFDNRVQVDKAPHDGEPAIPRVAIVIEATPQKNWSLWHVHVQTDPESSFDQAWAMEARVEYDGSGSLVPYYQLHQTAEPAAAAFDPHDWLSLEACALRGAFTKARVQGISEGESCVAVSMSVGARRALLPVGFTRQGEGLHLNMNLRNVRTRIDAKRVQ